MRVATIVAEQPLRLAHDAACWGMVRPLVKTPLTPNCLASWA
ncbi:MAG TPA: hypothetical protein VN791_08265 [Acidimicrobiales bacterium]|nr:hypothetical protein [Acidimicrobiales bacterium]